MNHGSILLCEWLLTTIGYFKCIFQVKIFFLTVKSLLYTQKHMSIYAKLFPQSRI